MSYLIRPWHDLHHTAGVHNYGAGVSIGMIDTGISWRSHPQEFDLDRLKVGERERDLGNHGTGIASLIVGRTLGLAPAASLHSYPVMTSRGRIAYGRVGQALNRSIANGHDLIIMALSTQTPSQLLKQACELAVNRGVILIAAAGNSPSRVSYPAIYNSVVSVGAVDAQGRVIPESGRLAGRNAIDFVDVGKDVTVASSDPVLFNRTGTSYAAAMVTGKLALGIAAVKRSKSKDCFLRWRRSLTRMSDRVGERRTAGHGVINLNRMLNSIGERN